MKTHVEDSAAFDGANAAITRVSGAEIQRLLQQRRDDCSMVHVANMTKFRHRKTTLQRRETTTIETVCSVETHSKCVDDSDLLQLT